MDSILSTRVPWAGIRSVWRKNRAFFVQTDGKNYSGRADHSPVRKELDLLRSKLGDSFIDSNNLK